MAKSQRIGKIKVTPEQAKEAEEFFLQFLGTEVNTLLKDSFDDINDSIKELVIRKLQAAPEWQSLIDGELNRLLEIDNGPAILNRILENISRNIEVKFTGLKQSGRAFFGSFYIKILNDNYQEVVDAVENGRGLNSNFNWIKTLLFAGDDHAIFNFGIDFQNETTTIETAKRDVLQYFATPFTPNVYIRQRPIEPRGVLQVPHEFRGTADNNFITRALEGIGEDVNNLIRGIVVGVNTDSLQDVFNADVDVTTRHKKDISE